MNKVWTIHVRRLHDKRLEVSLYRNQVTSVLEETVTEFHVGLEMGLNELREMGERPISVQYVGEIPIRHDIDYGGFWVTTEPRNRKVR